MRHFESLVVISGFRWLEVLESLVIWAALGTGLFCTARAVGLPLGFGETWILVTIGMPLQILPIQGIANAGNHEGGFVAGLAILGIPASEGLKFALTTHALVLFYVLMLAPVVLIARKRPGEKLQVGPARAGSVKKSGENLEAPT